MEKIIGISPSPVKVEKRNIRVHEGDHSDSGSRSEYTGLICDIVINKKKKRRGYRSNIQPRNCN